MSYLLGNTDLGLADPDLLPVLECQLNWHLDFSFFVCSSNDLAVTVPTLYCAIRGIVY